MSNLIAPKKELRHYIEDISFRKGWVICICEKRMTAPDPDLLVVEWNAHLKEFQIGKRH